MPRSSATHAGVAAASAAATAETADASRPVAIVTGANAGIGFHTALQLVRRGYVVVCACRSLSRGSAAVADINAKCRAAAGGAHDTRTNDSSADAASSTVGAAVFMQLDTSSLANVQDFAARFRERFTQLHALVCNAGINSFGLVPNGPGVEGDGIPLAAAEGRTTHTSEGRERVFTTNFTGHYVLTRLLLPVLLRTAKLERQRMLSGPPGSRGRVPVRVVCLSSVAHRAVTSVDWAAALSPTGMSEAYGASKLAMIAFARALQRRLDVAAQGEVMAVAVNPGAVASEIWRTLPTYLQSPIACIGAMAFLLPAQAAAVSVCAASEWTIEGAAFRGGEYLVPYAVPVRMEPFASLFEVAGPFAGPRLATPTSLAQSSSSAEALWTATEASVLGAGMSLPPV